MTASRAAAHPAADGGERLAAGRRDVGRRQPGRELVGVALARPRRRSGPPRRRSRSRRGRRRLPTVEAERGRRSAVGGLDGAAQRRADHGGDVAERSRRASAAACRLPDVVQRQVVAAGEAPARPSARSTPCRTSISRVGGPASAAPSAGAGGRRRRRCGRRPVRLAGRAVHRLVGQPVGVLVLLARDPLERRPRRSRRSSADASRASGRMRRVLDLPAPGHLLDDELGVHPHRDLAWRRARCAARSPAISPRYSATLLVAMPIDSTRSASTSPRGGVEHDRAVAGRAGVAARAAVGLDDDRVAVAATRHSPDSAVRTRMRAAVLAAHDVVGRGLAHAVSSLPDSSMRQPSQRRCRSSAAPVAAAGARAFS